MRRLGVDTITLARVREAVERSGPGFLERVYTPRELAYCDGRVERLAGRWAAKEAVIKCFAGTGLSVPRRRIEVLPDSFGAPRVTLLGAPSSARVEVSITHAGGIAVAAALLEADEGPAFLPAPSDVALPERPADAHKGTFGTVVAVAGSLGLTGAAYLSATAAARAGAGLVRLLVAAGIYPILAAKCTEVMATPVAEAAPGAIGHQALESVQRHLESATAGLVGPGLGRDGSTWRLIGELAAHARVPTVFDADALNALADNPRWLKRLAPNAVLTPHVGEMSRLVHLSAEEIQADRVRSARAAASEWGAVVVLKGAGTVVAAPDGRVSVDAHHLPAMASGGTGDVLAGIIAGLLAQGSPPYQAAVTGVYLHASAGRRLSSVMGEAGLLASDLLPEIPRVMALLREGGL